MSSRRTRVRCVVIVAAFTAILGVTAAWVSYNRHLDSQRKNFERLAAEHDKEAKFYYAECYMASLPITLGRGGGTAQSNKAIKYRKLSIYHGELRDKYNLAAKRPWDPVPLDPPPPL